MYLLDYIHSRKHTTNFKFTSTLNLNATYVRYCTEKKADVLKNDKKKTHLHIYVHTYGCISHFLKLISSLHVRTTYTRRRTMVCVIWLEYCFLSHTCGICCGENGARQKLANVAAKIGRAFVSLTSSHSDATARREAWKAVKYTVQYQPSFSLSIAVNRLS